MWWIPPLLAAATAALLYFGPTMASMASMSEPISRGRRPPLRAVSFTSLRSGQGPWVLTPLLIPVILALLPLIGRDPQSRRAFAVLSVSLLAVFYVLGSMSIGAFYLPTLFALVAVVVIDRLLPASGARDAKAVQQANVHES